MGIGKEAGGTEVAEMIDWGWEVRRQIWEFSSGLR